MTRRPPSDVIPVGLVGAGPWAKLVHAPVLAAGPETRLACVWARRPEAAKALADRYAAAVADSFDALLDSCDAVAFCVPPDVQAELAVRAAEAKKPMLLEKPIAGDVAGAERLVEAIDRNDARSMVLLTWRYAEPIRAFIAEASGRELVGGHASFINDGMVDGPFRTPWRLERGPVLDLGPHTFDLLQAALGPITDVRADGERLGFVSVLLRHESGATSTASICSTARTQPSRVGAEVYGREGQLAIDCAGSTGPELFATVRREFAETVAGKPHPLDARHGLALQRVIAEAEEQLAR